MAIGYRPLEDYLENVLSDEFYFVGTSTYREGVLKNVQENLPDILILREKLPGNQNISEIIYELRRHFPGVRIIFITGEREPGDSLLATLVNLQIFDIMASKAIDANEILNLIRFPNEYQHVAHLQPKVIVDENNKQMLYEAPTSIEVVKHVERPIYVERENPTSPTPEPEPKKGRKLRGGIFKKEEKVEETVVEPVVEEPVKRGLFGRKVKVETPEPVVESPKIDKKALKKQRDAERQEELRRQREQEELKNREAVMREERLRETARLQAEQEEKELLLLKTLELQKEVELLQKNKEAERFISRELPQHSKQKILTFMGSEHGVGNTQIALNTAVQLAMNGYKTIYIELRERPSTVNYLYQLFRNDKNGLESALFSLESQDYQGVQKSIIRMKDVIERTSNGDIMLDSYKVFPKNLDYLFFSPGYTEASNEISVGNPQALKELCMHLLFEGGYHFIVLDADNDRSNPYSEVALRFGTHVFYTITQDVCHIGNSIRQIAELQKSINIVDKLYYVVNKYENTELNKKEITDWLQNPINCYIPNYHAEFVNANYQGVPVLISTKQKELKKAFMEIAQFIQKM